MVCTRLFEIFLAGPVLAAARAYFWATVLKAPFLLLRTVSPTISYRIFNLPPLSIIL